MKKISIYLMLALAGLFMAACGPEDNEFAGLKVAEPDGSIVTPGLSVGQVGVINLNAEEYSDVDEVRAFSVPETALPEGVELSKAEIVFEDGTVMSASADGNVAAEDLSAYIASIYGLRPETRSVVGTVYLYAMQNGAAVKINAGETTFQVVPKAPVIAATYYLTGTLNEWNNSNTDYELGNGGQDPYANPTFTCVLKMEELGNPTTIKFKATPVDGLGGDWSGCLAAGEEGKFNYKNVGDDFVIDGINPNTKMIRLTFNMLDQTWSYAELSFNEYIYEAGVNNDWGAIEQPLYCKNQDGIYTGFFYAQDADWSGGKGAFKFTGAFNNWDNGNYGAGSNDDEGGTIIDDGGSGNLLVTPGFYRADVNLGDMTFKLTSITGIGLIGPAQAGGWDTDIDLTYNFETKAWEGTFELAADEFKFRANDGWDINWGGSEDNLTQGGSNLKITEAGTYFIQFFPLCETKSYCVITKQ